MTLWTALLVVLSGMVLAVLMVWAVPVLVVLEGEFREERRRGSLSVGLLMGLLGIRASFDGTGVRVQLLLFRRPSFSLPGRAGRPRPGPRREQAPAAPPEVRPEGLTSREEAPVAAPEARAEGPPKEEEAPKAPRPGAEPVREDVERAGVVDRLRVVWGYVSRFQRPAMRFLKTLRRAFRLRRATCDLAFGTGDPATTGQLCGVVYAVRPLLGPRVHIDIAPEFLTRRFEVRASLALCVSIARITYAVARLAATVGGALGWQYMRRILGHFRGGRQDSYVS